MATKRRLSSDSESSDSFEYDSDLVSISSLDSDFELSSSDELLSDDEAENEQLEDREDDIELPWVREGIPRPHFSFSCDYGIKAPDISSDNILEIFELYVDQGLTDLIVEETNRYAKKFIIHNHENIKPRSRVRAWTQTDAAEIKTFLGLLMLQSVCVKPSYELYFSRRESIETPFFSKVMAERRFALLCWKGRLKWKQFIPSKRKRFGIKLFLLCESSTGYTYNFLIYTGAKTNYGDNFVNEPLSARVVLELSNNLLDKGYCLFLDNYYTSVDLAEKLSQRRTDCVGTMRINRKGVPKDLKEKKLARGETFALFRKKLLKYKDKKEIIMISSLHDNQFVEKTKRGKVIKKPAVVEQYNQKMGGVDLTDNMLHFYAIARTHLKKYYKKIFLHFIDISVLNSYIIYKKLGGKKSRLNFEIDLAEKLIEKYGKSRNTNSVRVYSTTNST
nr:unnamed protein product [Callosobruchus analis]